MISLLIAFLLSAQGIPVLLNQGGTVTGILRNADGTPAVGVRVTAVARPDSALEAASAAAMSSLAETDEAGRYRLENIPPGHYYIAAGRIDLQTYYPGVLEMPGATDILIKAGDILPGIDFVMKDSSAGRAQGGLLGLTASASIPLKVTVERGARIPIFSPHGYSRLVLTRASDNVRISAPLDQSFVSISGPSATGTGAEYGVSIENLPDGYAVKSITYGSTNLMTSTLKIPAGNFVAPTTLQILQQLTAPTQPSIQATSVVIFAGVAIPLPSGPQLGTISVTLATSPLPTPAAVGARISGRTSNSNGQRSVYISGNPGILFSDGTFEFLGVPPGRHIVIASDTPRSSRPLTAVVIVGARDMDGIALEETFVLPPDFLTPAAPVADARAPGTIVRLATIRGRVVEETTRQGIPEGIVYISGKERSSFRLKGDGEFEIPHLLPGNYKLEMQVFGHSNISETINVGEDDITLELRTRLLVGPVE